MAEILFLCLLIMANGSFYGVILVHNGSTKLDSAGETNLSP